MGFSIRRTFFILLVLGLTFMTLRPIVDPDFWWHLRTGQLILQTHSIPRIDPFSFTKAGAPWITHEWLSELLFIGLFRLGEYGILIFVFSAIITGAFLFVYLRCPIETRPHIAGSVLLLGAVSSAPTWGVRPQMITLLMTSVFLFFLDRYRQTGKRVYLVSLPLLMLLWVNLHAGYFLGLILIGIHIVGGLIEILLAEFHLGELSGDVPTLNSTLLMCVSLGFCVLATLFNPNGIQMVMYPFQTLISPSMQQFIQEWFSPDFHEIMWQPLAILILALIGIGMVSKIVISPANILLTVILGYAALHSMRNVPLFAMAAIPVLSEQIGSLVKIKISNRTPSRLFRLIVPLLLMCLVLVIFVHFTQVIDDQPITEINNFPKAAVDWLLENRPQGNIFNSYNWGGYLIWRVYPEYQVYIDGRADIYGDAFIFDYQTIYRAQKNWDEKLIGQTIQTVLVESNAPIANALRQSPAWKIAFEDKVSIIFIR